MRSSLLFRQETLLKEVGIISGGTLYDEPCLKCARTLLMRNHFEWTDASKDRAGTGSPKAKEADPLAALAASDFLRRAQAAPALQKTHESAEELLDLDL